MHKVYSVNRYGHLNCMDFDQTMGSLAVSHFNHDFSNKEAFLDMLIRCEGTQMAEIDIRCVEGIIKAIAKPALYVNTTHRVDQYVISNYDTFWENVVSKELNCLTYYHMVLRVGPAILESRYGQVVAMMTQDDELEGLQNVAEIGKYDEELFGNTFKAFYKDILMSRDKVLNLMPGLGLLKFLQKRFRIEATAHEDKNTANAG